ncbi:MAG: methylenetetrahydrofolate--tRNA-(uracil(54)-C(5))-methyltransferase (FADH(2)-oxidizing) TrmFO [Anaerotardibacter sp.]
MEKTIGIIGAGLAGSEATLQLANRGYLVHVIEMRGFTQNPVHRTDQCAELVCSNSLKSMKENSAAGMLKTELSHLGSYLLQYAYDTQVPAGGALALNREAFSSLVTDEIKNHPNITYVCAEVVSITPEGRLVIRDANHEQPYEYEQDFDALVLASGPLTSDALGEYLFSLTGSDRMAFYDAAAPIVMADSLNWEKVFIQNRYEDSETGDYVNAAFNQEEYEAFAKELVEAQCVIKKSFETKDLFQACQPIEEIMRKGFDAPRFGPLKPVGIKDPVTGRRPWAVVQLRAEDRAKQSYNLVGFQTNLTFPEQKRVFSMIPGLENAEFARYGVMHRNTFINAPQLLDPFFRLVEKGSEKEGEKTAEYTSGDISREAREGISGDTGRGDGKDINGDTREEKSWFDIPVFVAGQLSGTEGYCEAIATGLYASLSVTAYLEDIEMEPLPYHTALGSLLSYATNPETLDYQPMHVNFGLFEPIEPKIKNKQQRYTAYAQRGLEAMKAYCQSLRDKGLLK